MALPCLHPVLHLGEECFLWLNSTLIFFSLAANIFYACCLIFPLHSGPRLKQPLRTLLGYLVWCCIMYCGSLPLLYWLSHEDQTFETLSWIFVPLFMYCSMTSYSRLNLFYYVQIVPHKRAVLVWLKKHIRPVIYVSLLFDGTLVLLDAIWNIVFTTTDFTYVNGTEHDFHGLYISSLVFFVSSKVHIFMCLCVMAVSSFRTAHYLLRHMRNMEQSGSSFYTPRIKSHIRITISGISQGVLYILYGTFYFIDVFTLMFSPDFYFTYQVYLTVSSVYIFGTTVNLGIGQTLFRKGAAGVWMAIKTLGVVATVTNDMKLHSSQVTPDKLVTVTVNGQMTL